MTNSITIEISPTQRIILECNPTSDPKTQYTLTVDQDDNRTELILSHHALATFFNLASALVTSATM